MNEKFTSNAEWPIEAGVSGNISTDSHDSRDIAAGVCFLLQCHGLGGNRKIFPLRTWVEPVRTCYDIINNGRPVSIVWATSPEEALKVFKQVHQQTARIHHTSIKLVNLEAVSRDEKKPGILSGKA